MESLPKTDAHYLESKRELTSNVIWTGMIENTPAIILDQTIFYPTGGGQPADQGWLILDSNEKLTITDVQKTAQSIALLLAKTNKVQLPAIGTEVTQMIDWNLRMAYVRHHSACHLLLPLFQDVISGIRPHGAGLTEEKARIDLQVEGKIRPSDLRRIENLAYDIILENRPLQSEFLPRAEAESQFDVGHLYWSEPPPPDATTIRITQIKEMPAYACGGTHVSSTAEIGLIKFVSRSRLEGGVDRIELLAGTPAFNLIQQQLSALEKTSKIFESSILEVPTFANRLKLHQKTLGNELKELKTQLLTYQSTDFLNDAEPIGTYRLFVAELGDLSLPDLENLVKNLVAKDPQLVALAGGAVDKAMIAGATGDNVPDIGLLNIVRDASSLLGGGAGGGPTFARGGGPNRNNLESALDEAKSALVKRLSE